MDLVKKIALGIGVASVIAGGILYSNQGKQNQPGYRKEKPGIEIKRDLVYQGYHEYRYLGGLKQLVFEGKSDLSGFGKPEGLERGEKYDVKFKPSERPGQNIIVSVKPSD